MDNKLLLNQLFKVSKIIFTLVLKQVKFECVIKMLLSSANKTGVALLFINAGKLFVYFRKG
jgi:hypothetical protein